MKLTDTLTGQLVDLKQICPSGKVSFYSCGPTVYDYPHIGNWYTFLRWDFLVRALEVQGWEVDWVMNITDVGHLTSDADDGEDKLAAQAKKKKQTAWEIANFYGRYFVEGLGRLNFRPPNRLPKATDHIDQQIELVKELEALGLTYTIADGVYYDTRQWPEYGRLSKTETDSDGQARIEPNPDKKSPHDFALWKLTPPGEKRDMEWDSPWGLGFPGWHIECSAMCRQYLGPTVTIHAGGFDHIPIHHTNEIAQTEPVTQKPLADIWLHSNFILVEGQKMSKSAGNFTVLEDIEQKGFSLAEFRLAVLAANYRTQANFSNQLLESAQKRLKDYRALSALRFQLSEGGGQNQTIAVDGVIEEILTALNSDLNGPQALAALDKFCNQSLDLDWPSENSDGLNLLLKTIEQLFGIDLTDSVKDLNENQKDILKHRAQARQAGDYPTADALRRQLKSEGLAVRDLPSGQQRWFPV